MTKQKKTIKKRPPGRPTKYRPEYDERAKGLCLLGYTNEMLAASFGVNVCTIGEWQHMFPTFADALNAGREVADSAVANALHEKAKAGDTTAMIFWLKNRMRNSWRDRHDVEAKVDANVQVGGEVDLNLLPDSELVQLKNILQKAVKPKPEKADKA